MSRSRSKRLLLTFGGKTPSRASRDPLAERSPIVATVGLLASEIQKLRFRLRMVFVP
jgi:hypothetical protein